MRYEDDDHRVEIQLPFPGFYHSWLDQELDHQAESFVEYEVSYRQVEEGVPPELRLDEAKLSDIMFDCRDFTKEHEAVARAYVEEFNYWLLNGSYNRYHRRTSKGIDLDLKYADMTSPKYYNFETDRLFATIPMRKVRLLFALSKRDKHRTLAGILKDRHTSYDGFRSFYSNDLSEWLEKPIEEWDHNELHSLLLACMKLLNLDDDDFVVAMLESDAFYHAWSDAMDWSKWVEKIKEARNEIIEEMKADDPDWVEPPYRCTETPDLFTGELHHSR